MLRKRNQRHALVQSLQFFFRAVAECCQRVAVCMSTLDTTQRKPLRQSQQGTGENRGKEGGQFITLNTQGRDGTWEVGERGGKGYNGGRGSRTSLLLNLVQSSHAYIRGLRFQPMFSIFFYGMIK